MSSTRTIQLELGRCGFSAALSALPRKLSACCPRDSLTERLQSLRPPPPTNSPQGKSWDSSCQPGVGKNSGGPRIFQRKTRKRLDGGGRGLSHSGRRPPRKATRPITAWFKAVQSVLSLYETLIYCFFCLKRQKRKRGKKCPSWRRGGAVNSGVNLRGFSHSCAVRRSHSRNNSSFFLFIFVFVSDRQASDSEKKKKTNNGLVPQKLRVKKTLEHLE